MRRALIVLALCGLSRSAAAQHCHQFTGDAWGRAGLALLPSVRVDAAGYRTPSYEGDYQGVAPALTFIHPRVLVLAMLPAYRLLRNGQSVYGVGDLAVAVRAPIRRWSSARLRAGFGVAVTLPTGSPAKDLGMGHVMLMPEFWWRSDHGPVQFTGTAGFGRALVSLGGSEHQHGPAPLVNPMNMSEIEGSLAAFARVLPRLSIKSSVYAALPVAAIGPKDRSRVIVAQGVVIGLPKLEIAAELQLGLVGQPFLARGVVQVGYRFDLEGRPRRAGGSRSRSRASSEE